MISYLDKLVNLLEIRNSDTLYSVVLNIGRIITLYNAEWTYTDQNIISRLARVIKEPMQEITHLNTAFYIASMYIISRPDIKDQIVESDVLSIMIQNPPSDINCTFMTSYIFQMIHLSTYWQGMR